jgi:hypothetical protein
MRQWIVWIGGAAVLGLAAWYFGKPAETPVVVIAKPQAAVVETPKPAAPKMLEVIDLARAYEPVRELEEVHPGGVNPASFIQVPEAFQRIPPARGGDDLYADVIRTVREEPTGWSLWPKPERERIEVMPREAMSIPSVPTSVQNGLLNFVPTPWVEGGGLTFVPMGVPYNLPSNESAVDGELHFIPVESLDVMPREVIGPTQDLLHFLPILGWM